MVWNAIEVCSKFAAELMALKAVPTLAAAATIPLIDERNHVAQEPPEVCIFSIEFWTHSDMLRIESPIEATFFFTAAIVPEAMSCADTMIFISLAVMSFEL